MKDDVKITYSFTSDNEQVRFEKVSELSNAGHIVSLKKKLFDFEVKMKEASVHYLLKEKLTSQQLEQLKIELKETKIESLPI